MEGSWKALLEEAALEAGLGAGPDDYQLTRTEAPRGWGPCLTCPLRCAQGLAQCRLQGGTSYDPETAEIPAQRNRDTLDSQPYVPSAE